MVPAHLGVGDGHLGRQANAVSALRHGGEPACGDAVERGDEEVGPGDGEALQQVPRGVPRPDQLLSLIHI